MNGFGDRGVIVPMELAWGVGGVGAWDMVPASPLKAAQPSSALIVSFLGLVSSLKSS